MKLLSITLFVFAISCAKSNMEIQNSTPEVMTKDTVIFDQRQVMGTLDKGSLDEASGMASSIMNHQTFWIHNDSGDKSRLFLVDTTATYKMTCTVLGATNRDWEDIAIAKDPQNGKSMIFIGDTGDNNAQYPHCTIYILEEPMIKNNDDVTVGLLGKIIYKYKEGPRDAETLMVDPISGDIIIVSKRETSVQLYQIKYPYNFSDTLVLEKLLVMPYTQIVAGDISPDGNEIVMKNYQKTWYWSRKKGMSVVEALSQKPYETTYIQEPQGESICWSSDAKAFYTLSEESPMKIKPILYRYQKK